MHLAFEFGKPVVVLKRFGRLRQSGIMREEFKLSHLLHTECIQRLLIEGYSILAISHQRRSGLQIRVDRMLAI